MTYKLFMAYPPIAHKLIHNATIQNTALLLQPAETGVYGRTAIWTSKLIPSFPPFIRGLYRAYPSLFSMLVHTFIHMQKYTGKDRTDSCWNLSRIISLLSTALSTGVKKRRQPGQADGVMRTEGAVLTS
jgi:hypothetical protein